jgi:hypothetical protein
MFPEFESTPGPQEHEGILTEKVGKQHLWGAANSPSNSTRDSIDSMTQRRNPPVSLAFSMVFRLLRLPQMGRLRGRRTAPVASGNLFGAQFSAFSIDRPVLLRGSRTPGAQDKIKTAAEHASPFPRLLVSPRLVCLAWVVLWASPSLPPRAATIDTARCAETLKRPADLETL